MSNDFTPVPLICRCGKTVGTLTPSRGRGGKPAPLDPPAVACPACAPAQRPWPFAKPEVE